MARHAPLEHLESTELSAIFGALADPTRRAILGRLAAGDATVAQLAEPFAMSQPGVSKHLKVLENAGLISRSRVATSHYSHLEAEPLREANAWMQRYKTFWNESFDKLDLALDDYLRAEPPPIEATPTDTAPDPKEG